MEKAALKPEEVWFCGDTYDKDVEGARATGIYAVFYQGNGADGANRQIIPDNRDKTIPFITDWDDLIEMLKNA